MHQEHYVVLAIMDTRWDDSYTWRGAMDDYQLFRRDGQRRREGGVALYVYIRECFGCLELDGVDGWPSVYGYESGGRSTR